MVLSLNVIGYYNHYNVGDEQYKESFVNLFDTYLNEKYTIKFIDCDTIQHVQFKNDDIIIIGGGDVLNNYFLDKINKVFRDKPNLIIAISVGLPYTETLITTDKLDIIDYIFIRTGIDIELFKTYFYPDRVFYLPDISLLLYKNRICVKNEFTKDFAKKGECENLIENKKDCSKNIQSIIKEIIKLRTKDKKIACICLSRHIYRKEYENEYKKILDELAKFILFLIERDYYIVFVPFNTNQINSNENDVLIANDLIRELSEKNESINELVINISETMSHDLIFKLFSNADLCIPMRFHAVLFSYYCYLPMIPIYTTRKIQNLLAETNWEFSLKLKTNEKCIPTDLDHSELVHLYNNLINKDAFRKNIYNKLLHINTNYFDRMFLENIKVLKEKITIEKKVVKDRSVKKSVYKNISDLYETINEFAQSRGFPDYRSVNDPNVQNIIVCIVSYHLTNGTINSIYNWGLLSKMFDLSKEYNHQSEWLWIINDHQNKRSSGIIESGLQLTNPRGLFNMDYVDQIDYSGAHRSGWQYVYKHIQHFHNSNSEILLDLYIDRTFHWNKEVNKVLELIPYKSKWIGFIHHTFDTTFSDYNCKNLLEQEDFLESLHSCKALFVLSEYLKSEFESAFKERGINVPLYVLTHPTETNVKRFDYRSFFENGEKKLIHIGGWLRNVYSFYNLSLPEKTRFKFGFFAGDLTLTPIRTKTETITKVALRGKNMNNYYPPNQFIDTIKKTLENIEKDGNVSNGNESNVSTNISSNVSSNASTNYNNLANNWNKHFYEDLCNKFNDIKFIEYLNNDEYDQLLTNNIVYINLVDASAVNTIIECIVRATPIIVNNHPAVVELLGKNYPLYFKSSPLDYTGINREINRLFVNDSKIKSAHNYLKRKSLTPFKIKTFVDKFEKILKKINKI